MRGKYAITETGEVYSYKKNKYLTPTDNGYGYKFITLYGNGKKNKHYIHRLVLETFKPVENMAQLQCNHIDENKSNNNLSNLEWCTAKENANSGTRNERSAKARSMKVYCRELDRIFNSMNEAADELEINSGHICECCKGQRKTAGRMHWKYVKINGKW
jgi:hypothetical protein